MRLLSVLPLLAAAPRLVLAADRDTTSELILQGTVTSINEADFPTGTYLSYDSTITVPTTKNNVLGDPTPTGDDPPAETGNSTAVHTTTSASVTLLVGGQGTTTLSGGNATATGNATSTSSASATPLPTNTRPCNGYPEFCSRNYSNITMVAAHNSPFVMERNWAANQALDVTTQLNDGIRMCKSGFCAGSEGD